MDICLFIIFFFQYLWSIDFQGYDRYFLAWFSSSFQFVCVLVDCFFVYRWFCRLWYLGFWLVFFFYLGVGVGEGFWCYLFWFEIVKQLLELFVGRVSQFRQFVQVVGYCGWFYGFCLGRRQEGGAIWCYCISGSVGDWFIGGFLVVSLFARQIQCYVSQVFDRKTGCRQLFVVYYTFGEMCYNF